MLPTRLLRVAVVALATAAVACGDPTRPKATIVNVQLTYSVYGLIGAPAASANALNLFVGPARADATFDFDVALDLDPSGKILVYPVRAIAGPLAGVIPTRVGLLPVTGSFESVRAAPDRGYDTLGVQKIEPGTVVVAELVNLAGGLCIFSISGSQTYAKFVVDSVNTPARRFYVRTLGDANCGYRSLVADSLPTF
jgi:hypothetical protein